MPRTRVKCINCPRKSRSGFKVLSAACNTELVPLFGNKGLVCPQCISKKTSVLKKSQTALIERVDAIKESYSVEKQNLLMQITNLNALLLESKKVHLRFIQIGRGSSKTRSLRECKCLRCVDYNEITHIYKSHKFGSGGEISGLTMFMCTACFSNEECREHQKPILEVL